MKVLMVGHYNLKSYSRGKILYKGLIKNNVDVDIFLGEGRFKYFKIARRILKDDYDVVIATGVITLFVSKLLSRKPVIFDAFISNYDTLVYDRKLVPEGSLKAKLLWLADKYSCKFADIVIVDTEEHKNYFVSEFNLNSRKFKPIPIGADDEIFYPTYSIKKKDHFLVLFFGTFIPLQGIEYIVETAKLLRNNKDIKFEILGSGQTYEKNIALSKKLKLKNISFKNIIINKNPQKYIERADVCLGIFGHTDKVKRVIPNKAYETIAMKKPLITGNTPAVRRFFKDKKNCILCKTADSKSIANAILELKNNPELQKRIAVKGYELFRKKFSIEIIGKNVLKILKECKI